MTCITTKPLIVTYLFLGEPGADTNYIYYIALHDTHIGKVASAQRIKVLPLALPLLLLLCQALMANR